MSIPKRAPKRDKNEKEIVTLLRARGCSVQLLSASGLPDLLIGINCQNILAEVKGKYGKLTPDEKAWFENWRGGKIYILRTIEDTLTMLNHYTLELIPEPVCQQKDDSV